MSKLHVPTRGDAIHDVHNDTTITTKTLVNVLPSCRRVLRASRRLAVGAGIVVFSACAATTGEPVVQRPALEVPPPPPRVITPLPVPETVSAEQPVEDPATAKPAPTKPKPQSPATTGKPEPKPETPPVEAAPPVAPPPVTPPPPTLSTPPQGDANALSRQIRESIDRTRRTLEKINYGPLSNDRKKAYDDSKLFATQAEDALKVSNLVFAKELADKAERLAKELQGR